MDATEETLKAPRDLRQGVRGLEMQPQGSPQRIASVKSTQKITKAMKWSRRPSFAGRRRPRKPRGPMPSAWSVCLLAERVTAHEGVPLLIGTGKEDTISSSSPRPRQRPLRRFQHKHCAQARQHAAQEQGKTVKILCVGRKGWTSSPRLRRRSSILEAPSRRWGSTALPIGQRVCRCSRTASSTSAAYLPTSSRSSPSVTACSSYRPSPRRKGRSRGGRQLGLRIEPEEEEIAGRSCRATSRPDFRHAGKCRGRARCAHDRRTMRPAMRAR